MTPEEQAAATAAAAEAAKNNPPANNPPANNPPPKTYTQEELNSIAAREKEQGRTALLKELGIEDVTNYKDSLAKFKEHQESQKTETQKANEKAANEVKAKEAEMARADLLEAKLNVIKAGGLTEFVDDITLLVKARVSTTKTFEQALAEVKEKHPTYFNQTNDPSKSKGTGGKPNAQQQKAGNAGLGQRLAQAQKPATKTESSYFKNK